MSERTMSELPTVYSGLAGPDLELLRRIGQGMPITADLSRSDILLLFPRSAERVVVAEQAQPHSIASLYDNRLIGNKLTPDEAPAVFEAWRGRRHVRTQHQMHPSRAPVMQDVYPIYGANREIIALMSFEISLIQLERHRSRHRSFRQAIELLKSVCMRGELADTATLSPFSEWDGVLLVDPMRRITYLSGIANNLYRRLGYLEDLRGQRLSFLNTTDDDMVRKALESRTPYEAEVQEGSRMWVRKVLPVWAPPNVSSWMRRLVSRQGREDIGGVLIMVHDATDERLKKQELKVKTTMIQEVHHRVKNNLQTIAAMLRMQARRTQDGDALLAINEAISRILSVAVIHEFLSRHEAQAINVRDVGQRIITQSRQVAVTPGLQISFSLEGPNIYLPSQQATAVALVINELIQNAVEHGFEGEKSGQVRLVLIDGGDQVKLEIWDDGDRLPADFDLTTTPSLGLQIVRSLVQDDLHGKLTLANHEAGVLAAVQFPKLVVAPDAG
jgi:two-component system, sensor histidine kinase PdtaS